jgi:hypothetical protein
MEMIISLIAVLFGCGQFAYYINNIGIILKKINKKQLSFEKKFKILIEYM